jgi:hypothetical protein
MELYAATEYVDFQDEELLQKRPIKFKTNYIKEISFEFSKTTTSHFELIHNSVLTKDNRIPIINSLQFYEYFELSEKYTSQAPFY